MAPLVSAIREPQGGGSQAFLSDLARGLVSRGHDVHVYAATGSEIPGVTVIDTGVDPAALAATLFRAAAGRPATRARLSQHFPAPTRRSGRPVMTLFIITPSTRRRSASRPD